MKKVLKLLLVIGLVLLFGVSYYFVRFNNFKVNKNVYVEEKENVSKLMDNINGPLTMLIISNCIDNLNEMNKYDVSKNENLLENIKYKQQFTMEYFIRNDRNFDKFLLVNQEGNEDEDSFVTEEMTVAYLKYEDFNKTYNKLFGKDFDMNNREYSYFKTWDDKGYVYYSNRRAGSNGLFIISYDIENILKTGDVYKSKIILNYNDNLKEKLNSNNMLLEYSYIDNNIIIKSISFV